MEFAVLRGRAELANEDGRTPLRAGERAFVRAAAAPSYAYVANSAAADAFDRWSEARRSERMAASAQYLPSEVRPYAASLEHHGYWRDEPTYGRVWYPRVERDWRPYYRGRWVLLRLDVGGARSVGMADASLRPLGVLERRLVLDPRAHLGCGVGVMGVCPRICELVPARMEQSPRVPDQRQHRTWVRSMARMDGGSTAALRLRLRAPVRCPFGLPRSPRPHVFRVSGSGTRNHRVRGAPRRSANPRGRDARPARRGDAALHERAGGPCPRRRKRRAARPDVGAGRVRQGTRGPRRSARTHGAGPAGRAFRTAIHPERCSRRGSLWFGRPC